MKSSKELLDYVEKSGYKTRYGSDGDDALADMIYALSLGETAVKQHAEMWKGLCVKDEDVGYQKAIRDIHEFLIGE